MARFLDGCNRCDKCLQGCPHDAIVHAPDRLREAAGTPIIDPDQQPCMMCDDFPCIAACEPNVLTDRMDRMRRVPLCLFGSRKCNPADALFFASNTRR